MNEFEMKVKLRLPHLATLFGHQFGTIIYHWLHLLKFTGGKGEEIGTASAS